MHCNTRKIIFLLCIGICVALSPTSYLSPVDKNHLKSVLDKVWTLTDISQVSYGVAGYKLLNLEVPDKQKVCTYLKNSVQSKPTAESLYFASLAGKNLGCPITAPAGARQTLSDTVREESSLLEVFFAVSAQTNLRMEIDEAKVLKFVQQALKKDDSIVSLGHAFHIGAQLKGDTKLIFERAEDAIVQADEVDGELLQFEGGLSITAFILSGLFKLTEASKKAMPLKKNQIVKFSNYLMSRKTVQIPKGAYYLLEAVNTLTNNKFHIPISITLASNIAVSPDSPKIKVRVTNLMGSNLGPVKLTAVTASEGSSGKAILSNKSFLPVSGHASLYEVDIMSAKPSRGFYKLSINVEGSDNRLAGNLGASVDFKVLSAVSLQDIQLGTADSDQTMAPNLKKITYPIMLSEVIEADYHQRLVLRFLIKDTYASEAAKVHQTFVKMTHVETNREIVFVAEPDPSGLYKFDMDINSNKKEFAGMSGKYSMELVVGDACISNSMSWELASVLLKFPQEPANKKEDYTYKPRAEIHHQFRTPDPRPPTILSMAFTALCMSPLLILLVGWVKLGVNMNSFPMSLSAIGFHVGLGSIFVLFCWFWLELNMFTTLRYLACLGVVTFLCGNSMLSSIAERRKEK